MKVAAIGAGSMAHVLQSADVYASFGIQNAVMGSSDPAQHEQNMLALNVDARDGDDSLTTVDPEVPEEELEEEQEESEEEEQEEESEDQNNEESDEDSDFVPLGEPSKELQDASSQIDEYAEGFASMRAQAVTNGLPEAVADRIEQEYEEDGKLSDDSYAELAKAGFAKGFVNSFMQGQQALAETFVSKIIDYAGGKEAFNKVTAHLQANSPGALSMLHSAIERQDIEAIKETINLGMASRAKKFGKTPERSVTKRANAPVVAAKGPKGYASQSEMVAAMSDRKYQTDATYRAQVEAKVAASSW